jgi:hypothetical protein
MAAFQISNKLMEVVIKSCCPWILSWRVAASTSFSLSPNSSLAVKLQLRLLQLPAPLAHASRNIIIIAAINWKSFPNWVPQQK